MPFRLLSLSKKSACGGLFRQKLKKCLRPGAQTPRPPGTGGKRQPCGLLPPKAAKRPEGAPEGSVCPVGTWAEGPKRPEGAPEGSVSPVGCCAKRKATRRRTAKRAVGAASALRDD